MNGWQSHDTSGYVLLKQTFQLKWDPDVVRAGMYPVPFLGGTYGMKTQLNMTFMCTSCFPYYDVSSSGPRARSTWLLRGAQCLAHGWFLKAGSSNKSNNKWIQWRRFKCIRLNPNWCSGTKGFLYKVMQIDLDLGQFWFPCLLGVTIKLTARLFSPLFCNSWLFECSLHGSPIYKIFIRWQTT